VLHGTDTMAYTASALSFMLVNLGKTVVLTGSQIPLFEVRNDAIDNLLGALTIAGHFEIPEVCLYFHNKLMRGNRTQKVDALGLNAFHSGNLSPLVEVGIQLDVHWHRVRAAPMDPLKVRTITERNVACLRIFPGITAEILQNFMLQPLQGVIIETFGAGNAPDVRPDFLDVLRKASDRGVVIVNVTQCHRGGATIDYATGQSLAEVGVVSGLDMTPEAALSKLSYLLSQPELDRDDVCRLMQVSLRGELTEPHSEHIFSFAKGREAEI
jgi:lysophospholipase